MTEKQDDVHLSPASTQAQALTAVTHQPATALPWIFCTLNLHFAAQADDGMRVFNVRFVRKPGGRTSADDARYIVHAANAYPKLIAALRHVLTAFEDATPKSEDYMGVTAAFWLLRELGELTAASAQPQENVEAK